MSRFGPEIRFFLQSSAVSIRVALLSGLALLGPLALPDAHAQQTTWRVTVIEVSSEGDQVPGCVANVSVDFVLPAPTGTANANVCGLQAQFKVEAQQVTFSVRGSLTIQPCVWDITGVISGVAPILGDSTPPTSMAGTATSTCGGAGNFTNKVTVRFQSQRLGGAPPPTDPPPTDPPPTDPPPTDPPPTDPPPTDPPPTPTPAPGGVTVQNFTGKVTVTRPG